LVSQDDLQVSAGTYETFETETLEALH